MRVLLTGAFSSLNRGDEARVKCSVKMIQALMPDTRFDFLTSYPERDQEIYQKSGIEMVSRYKYGRRFRGRPLSDFVKGADLLLALVGAFFWRISGGSLGMFRSKQFAEYDMFIDLSGETLTDYYGLGNLLWCLSGILLGIILKRQVVIYAQSIGPLRNKTGRVLARLVLNKVDLIIVRDEYSVECLQEIQIDEPHIHLTADPAFILEPVSSARVEEIQDIEGISGRTNGPLIGVTASRGAYRRSMSGERSLEEVFQAFIRVMGETLDHLVEQLDAEVVLIPHAIGPCPDDRAVAEQIYRSAEKKERLRLVAGEYTSEELKGVIGECDLFIGSRMHASIAALSSCIPTVVVAYSHKMPSLMKRLGLEEYVCNVETITVEEMISKVTHAWINRATIRSQLAQKIDEMRKTSSVSAQLVRDLFYNRQY